MWVLFTEHNFTIEYGPFDTYAAAFNFRNQVENYGYNTCGCGCGKTIKYGFFLHIGQI